MYIDHIIHKCDNARLNTQLYMYQRCTQIQINIITISFIGFAQSNIHVNHVFLVQKYTPPLKKKPKGKIKRKKEKKCQKRQTNTLSNNSIRYTCS